MKKMRIKTLPQRKNMKNINMTQTTWKTGKMRKAHKIYGSGLEAVETPAPLADLAELQ